MSQAIFLEGILKELHSDSFLREALQVWQCGKNFKTDQSLRSHRRVHLPHTEEWKCEVCQMNFKRKDCLTHHLMYVHLAPKIHTCNLCPASFAKKVWLKRHGLKHTDLRPFQCEKCELRFKTNYERKMHQSKIHEREKSHQCLQCQMSFYSSVGLKSHSLTHSERKDFQCEEFAGR